MRGEPFLCPAAVAALTRDYLARQEAPADPLSPGELQVLKRIAEAYTSDGIAARGMRDRVELTRYAIKRGLVDP